ncbi:site-2 protease family protein [Candidatus Methanomassiliicoccus intestinalis]|uniref:site-2 protease family protein n=1 Tax=Candidatus Methanomassiliicoccus intestinalis TaxID=1406512 RepID=UPI0037DCE326
MNGYLIAIILIIAFWAAVYILDKKGILAKHNMSAWGPFVMWRTKRGRNLIDKLSRPHRFWNGYALISKGIVAAIMFGMTALLLWESTLVVNIPAENAPGFDMVLGIPGINPIIPLWYGILGMIVAVIIHEFAHGILTRVHGMGVKSLGIVWMVIPMGAFTEPDEEALEKTTKKKRTAVYAVGPATNIIAAVIFAVLFSSVAMSAVAPTYDAPMASTVYSGGPANMAGIPVGAQIIAIDGVELEMDGYLSVNAPDPNNPVQVEYYYNGEFFTKEVISGVILTQIVQNMPSGEAGLKPGMMLYSLNGEIIRNGNDFSRVMEEIPFNPEAPTAVPIVVYAYNSENHTYEVVESVTEITPTSKLEYYETRGMSTEGIEEMAFLGVSTAYLGMVVTDPQALIDSMAHPFAGDDSLNDYFQSFLTYVTLPLKGYQSFPDALAAVYEPQGIFAGMSSDSFWIMTNCFYWLFWINLMLGLTNALPAIPLDGGYIFRDWLDSFLQKVRKTMPEKERLRIVDSVAWAFALLILFLILWMVIGPRL